MTLQTNVGSYKHLVYQDPGATSSSFCLSVKSRFLKWEVWAEQLSQASL